MRYHPTKASDDARFWSKVNKTDTCWLWTGAPARGNYGSFGAQGRTFRAHRYAYELHYGPIPDGLHLDHRCHNEDPTCPGGPTCRHRRCVNPAHLEAVTPYKNALNGLTPAAVNARKTHCDHGHEYTPENTYAIPVSPYQRYGARACRACRQLARARHYAKRQAAKA
jgi:hypothetical protein